MAKEDLKTKPEIVFADVTDERTVELSWKAVKEATGYNIERYDREKDKFVKIGSVGANATSFTCKKEPKDGVYQYRINALKTVEGKLRPISKKGSARAVNISSIPAVNITGIESPAFGKVRITWEKDENAAGYVINRRLEEMNESVVRGEAEKDNLFFVDDTATSGQVYYYNVQSYIIDETASVPAVPGADGSLVRPQVRIYSNTGREECFVCVDSTEILCVRRKLFKKVSFEFRMTAGVSCYILYKSSTKDGEYKEVARTENGSTLTLADKGESGERSAYYKIGCCKKVNGKDWFGKKTESVLVNYKL